MRRVLLTIAAAGVSACTGGMSTSTPPAPTSPSAPTVAAVSVTGAPATAAAPFQLTATARFSDATTQDVTRTATWQSSDATVVTVANGFVTTIASGQADVRATYQGITGVTHVTVALPKQYTVSGVVTDASVSGHPIVSARIQDVGGGFALSDATGAFSLPGIPAGLLLIEFSKSGYQTVEQELVISGDTRLNVALVPTATASAYDRRR